MVVRMRLAQRWLRSPAGMLAQRWLPSSVEMLAQRWLRSSPRVLTQRWLRSSCLGCLKHAKMRDLQTLS